MTSQLNVDTIVDKAGSGGTNVKVANTSTYVSDGGATTQNTVQSLVKCWYLDNEGGSSLDSFNVASNTDNSTGNYTKGFTSNFSSDNFSSPGVIAQNTDAFVINQARATSSVTLVNITHSGGSTDGRQACNICGDLA
jgi:hypothetical protein